MSKIKRVGETIRRTIANIDFWDKNTQNIAPIKK